MYSSPNNRTYPVSTASPLATGPFLRSQMHLADLTPTKYHSIHLLPNNSSNYFIPATSSNYSTSVSASKSTYSPYSNGIRSSYSAVPAPSSVINPNITTSAYISSATAHSPYSTRVPRAIGSTNRDYPSSNYSPLPQSSVSYSPATSRYIANNYTNLASKYTPGSNTSRSSSYTAHTSNLLLKLPALTLQIPIFQQNRFSTAPKLIVSSIETELRKELNDIINSGKPQSNLLLFSRVNNAISSLILKYSIQLGSIERSELETNCFNLVEKYCSEKNLSGAANSSNSSELINAILTVFHAELNYFELLNELNDSYSDESKEIVEQVKLTLEQAVELGNSELNKLKEQQTQQIQQLKQQKLDQINKLSYPSTMSGYSNPAATEARRFDSQQAVAQKFKTRFSPLNSSIKPSSRAASANKSEAKAASGEDDLHEQFKQIDIDYHKAISNNASGNATDSEAAAVSSSEEEEEEQLPNMIIPQNSQESKYSNIPNEFEVTENTEGEETLNYKSAAESNQPSTQIEDEENEEEAQQTEEDAEQPRQSVPQAFPSSADNLRHQSVSREEQAEEDSGPITFDDLFNSPAVANSTAPAPKASSAVKESKESFHSVKPPTTALPPNQKLTLTQLKDKIRQEEMQRIEAEASTVAAPSSNKALDFLKFSSQQANKYQEQFKAEQSQNRANSIQDHPDAAAATPARFRS
jgi:hypothetical protein